MRVSHDGGDAARDLLKAAKQGARAFGGETEEVTLVDHKTEITGEMEELTEG